MWDKTGIHFKYQELFFSNQKLEDGRLLSDYCIWDKSTIDVKLIVPSLEEVVEVMATFKAHVDAAWKKLQMRW